MLLLLVAVLAVNLSLRCKSYGVVIFLFAIAFSCLLCRLPKWHNTAATKNKEILLPQQFTYLNHNTLESESDFSYSSVKILKMTPILCFLNCEILGCHTVLFPRRIPIFGRNMLPPSSGLNYEEWRIGLVIYAGCKKGDYSDTRQGFHFNPRRLREHFPP